MALKEINEFAKRVLGDLADSVSFEEKSSDTGNDTFTYECTGGRLKISGNTTSALTQALGHYLLHIAKVNILWRDFPVRLECLPDCAPLKKTVEQKYRVYMNYCTFNYTASWWEFDRWEREIDMMALYGINMPLCVIGTEVVWYETLLKFGFTDEEARSFLCGPAFLAWQ